MGGYNGSYLSSTEVLDLNTGVWRAGPELPYPAYDGRVLHYDGQHYLVCGYGSAGKIVRLSYDRNTWEEQGLEHLHLWSVLIALGTRSFKNSKAKTLSIFPVVNAYIFQNYQNYSKALNTFRLYC